MKIEKIYKEIGSRIRLHRKKAGVTQEKFAKRVGISRPALVNMELGRQRIMLHNFKRIANALQIHPQVLLRSLWL